jgi:hypothetical protein
MRTRAIAVAAIFVGAYLASTGKAAAIGTLVETQGDAPVHVTKCIAHIRSVSNGWGTHFLTLDTGASFQNDSAKTAVAVLVRFRLTNVFGDSVDNLFGQSSGQFATGVPIDGNKWSTTDTWPGLGIVRCSINRVLFSDGSTWSEPGGPTPSPSPAPQRSRSR